MKVTNRLLKRKRRDVYFSAYIEWLSRNSTKRLYSTPRPTLDVQKSKLNGTPLSISQFSSVEFLGETAKAFSRFLC
jgi:hypothetical protein